MMPTYLFYLIDLFYPFPTRTHRSKKEKKKNNEANVEFIFIFGVKIKPFFFALLSNCSDRSHGNEFLRVHMEWGELVTGPTRNLNQWIQSRKCTETKKETNVCRCYPNIHIQ